MANDLTGKMPTGLAQYRKSNFNERFKVDVTDPMGRISTDNRRFTLIYKDNQLPLMSKQGNPATYMDFCVIDGSPIASRTYWENPKPKPGQRPDCASLRGDKPDPGSAKPQNKTCLGCKHNVFGTGLDGKSKRCGSAYRIAVLPAVDFNNEAWGGPMQVRITPGTWKAWSKYRSEQDGEGRDLNMIVTRFRFDPEAQFQKFQFAFQRWIDPETEAPWVAHWSESPECERITRAIETGSLLDYEEGDEEGETPEEFEPEPTISAADKMAAARAASSTAQSRAAPPPAPFATDDEEEDEPAPLTPPAKTNVVALGTPSTKPTVTAKPVPSKNKVVTPVKAGPIKPPVVKQPEPEPATDAETELNALLDKLEVMDQSNPLYARLMKKAEALTALVSSAAAPALNGEIVDDDEELEEAPRGMASTKELLSVLDEDLEGQIPD